MGYTSMCQFHTQWSHFSRQMVTIDYDGVSTHLMIILQYRMLHLTGAPLKVLSVSLVSKMF